MDLLSFGVLVLIRTLALLPSVIVFGCSLPFRKNAVRHQISETSASSAFIPGRGGGSSLGENDATLPLQWGNQSLAYSIFNHGRSALRDLPSEWQERLRPGLAAAPTKALWTLELIVADYLDAAHEVLLGVSFQELEYAEYAGTHRGQTNWTQDHPLSEMDDILHSIIHRLEGWQEGEGGYTGFGNAKYWIAGGPKALPELPTTLDHPVYHSLARYAEKNYPHLTRGSSLSAISRSDTTANALPPLIPQEDVLHEIIAGGGRYRTVRVKAGSWDGIAVVDLWRRATDSALLRNQLYDLHRVELELWRRQLQQQQQQQQLESNTSHHLKDENRDDFQ